MEPVPVDTSFPCSTSQLKPHFAIRKPRSNPTGIVSKKDFDFMRQEGDIGSMDYDQAVKNGDIFFGWSTWMERYTPSGMTR